MVASFLFLVHRLQNLVEPGLQLFLDRAVAAGRNIEIVDGDDRSIAGKSLQLFAELVAPEFPGRRSRVRIVDEFEAMLVIWDLNSSIICCGATNSPVEPSSVIPIVFI